MDTFRIAIYLHVFIYAFLLLLRYIIIIYLCLWLSMQVGDLGPLAACTMLCRVDCGWTRVVLLAPLAACTSLVTVDCDEGVPLSQVTLLQAACGGVEVTRWDPANLAHTVHAALHPRP